MVQLIFGRISNLVLMLLFGVLTATVVVTANETKLHHPTGLPGYHVSDSNGETIYDVNAPFDDSESGDYYEDETLHPEVEIEIEMDEDDDDTRTSMASSEQKKHADVQGQKQTLTSSEGLRQSQIQQRSQQLVQQQRQRLQDLKLKQQRQRQQEREQHQQEQQQREQQRQYQPKLQRQQQRRYEQQQQQQQQRQQQQQQQRQQQQQQRQTRLVHDHSPVNDSPKSSTPVTPTSRRNTNASPFRRRSSPFGSWPQPFDFGLDFDDFDPYHAHPWSMMFSHNHPFVNQIITFRTPSFFNILPQPFACN